MILTKQNLPTFLEEVYTETVIVLDTETNWTDDVMKRYCLGIAIYLPKNNKSYYFPVKHSDYVSNTLNFKNEIYNLSDDLLKDFFKGINLAEKIVTFNNKFDVTVIEKLGYYIPVFKREDAILQAWLLNENEQSHSLEYLAKKYTNDFKFNESLGKLRKIIPWECIPVDIMAQYAEQDCIVTWKLYVLFSELMSLENLEESYRFRLDFSEILRRIELRGIAFNSDLAKQYSEEALTEASALQVKLGYDPLKPSQLAGRLFQNPPEGLGLPCVARGAPSKSFPLGRPKMGKRDLESLRHPEVTDIIRYRQLLKANSVWYTGWQAVASTDGRIHPTFNQIDKGTNAQETPMGARTGRLTCKNPNMQQIPRSGRVKELVTATVGYSLLEFDYSQLELRLAAVYSEEPALINAFLEGKDIHQQVADDLGIDRHLGKTVNFLILYGGGADKLSQTAEIPFEQARSVLNRYFATYPGIKSIMNTVNKTMANRKFILLWSGRKRRLVNSFEAHKAFNSLIQGGAADICAYSMVAIEKNRALRECKLISQVHDSMWIEIPVGKEDIYIPEIKHTIEDWATDKFGLPFITDYKYLYKGHYDTLISN